MQTGDAMHKTIQTLLNGYERPAILSDASDHNIVFLNDAAKKELGISSQQAADSTLYDLFTSRRVIRENVIWERSERQFEITEEYYRGAHLHQSVSLSIKRRSLI